MMPTKPTREAYRLVREEALRALEKAGLTYKESIEKVAMLEKGYFRDLDKTFREQMTDLGATAVDTFHQMAISTARELGNQGGLGQFGEHLAGLAGEMLGKGLNIGIGKALGVATGPWAAIAAEAGKFLGTQLAQSFERFESMRMLGAKRAAAMTGGVPTGGENYFEMGRQYTLQSLEIRGVTGQSAQAVDELVTQLSRAGIKFDEVGKEAVKYALSADYLLNVEKGLTAELESDAVQKYGESWKDATMVIQDTTAVTQYWQAVAEQTGSAQAKALASNQNVLETYKKVMEATKGTGMSMTGLAAIMSGAVNTFGKLGLRPEMISSMTAEFVSKIAPRTSGMEDTIKQGFFIRETLATTEAGRRINAMAMDITRNENMDPLLSNIGLSMLMARDDDATEQFSAAFLESVGASRDQIQGDPAQQNAIMMWKINTMTGMSPLAAQLTMKLADEYRTKLNAGVSPTEALREAGKNEEVEALAGQLGMRGVSPEEMIKRMNPLGNAAMSTEQKIALSTERMATIHEPKAFWGNMGTSIMEGLKKVGQVGAVMTGEGTAGLKHAARLAEQAPARSKNIHLPSEHRLHVTDSERRKADEALNDARRRRGKPLIVSSYTTQPGHGVRQTNISVDESYFADSRKAIEEITKQYFPDDPSAVKHMMALAAQESFFDPSAVGDHGLAEGLFQMHPELREKYGVGKESSPAAQTAAAAQEMQELLQKYGGNWDRAIEEYHLGNPAVRRGKHDPKYMQGYQEKYADLTSNMRMRG